MDDKDPVLRELKKIRKQQQKIAGDVLMCVVYSGAALTLLWLIWSSMETAEEE